MLPLGRPPYQANEHDAEAIVPLHIASEHNDEVILEEKRSETFSNWLIKLLAGLAYIIIIELISCSKMNKIILLT